MRVVGLLVGMSVMVGCGKTEPAQTCAPCVGYGPAAPSGVVMAPLLDEISGLAASRRNPGVLFMHNDRDAPELFAVSEAGALLASFTYAGAADQHVEDVEDVAVGDCPAGTCVFLADTGGNLSARTSYAIVRLAEPAVEATASVALAAEWLSFTYPDGAAHDAESLLVAPRGEALYVIDKVAYGEVSTVYRLPATFGGPAVVATKIATLPVPGQRDLPATAADAHPCGAGFILATGNTAYEFRIAADAPFEESFAAAPVVVPVAVELQREGIAYAPDGRSFFTTGEGSSEPINRTSCP